MSSTLSEILSDVTVREGSQQEAHLRNASVSQKIEILERSLEAGVKAAELTGFAPGPWFSDAEELAEKSVHLREKGRLKAIYFNTDGAESLLAHSHLVPEGLFHTAATSRYREENYRQRSFEHALTKLNRMLQFFQDRALKFDTCILSTAWGEDGEGATPHDVCNLLQKITERGEAAGLPLFQATLADTVGNASPDEIAKMVAEVKAAFPELRVVLHLHPRSEEAYDCVSAGIEAGANGWEGAWGGVGGSPFASGAGGNLDINVLLKVFQDRGLETGLDESKIEPLLSFLKGCIPKQ